MSFALIGFSGLTRGSSPWELMLFVSGCSGSISDCRGEREGGVASQAQVLAACHCFIINFSLLNHPFTWNSKFMCSSSETFKFRVLLYRREKINFANRLTPSAVELNGPYLFYQKNFLNLKLRPGSRGNCGFNLITLTMHVLPSTIGGNWWCHYKCSNHYGNVNVHQCS